jgi:hypothetical protein
MHVVFADEKRGCHVMQFIAVSRSLFAGETFLEALLVATLLRFSEPWKPNVESLITQYQNEITVLLSTLMRSWFIRLSLPIYNPKTHFWGGGGSRYSFMSSNPL